jgi:hypothetical protein
MFLSSRQERAGRSLSGKRSRDHLWQSEKHDEGQQKYAKE